MDQSSKWYKKSEDSQIWWLDNSDRTGEWVFSFDRKKEFNLFSDYPWELSAEQKKIFDEENPEWADFFSDRT